MQVSVLLWKLIVSLQLSLSGIDRLQTTNSLALKENHVSHAISQFPNFRWKYPDEKRTSVKQWPCLVKLSARSRLSLQTILHFIDRTKNAKFNLKKVTKNGKDHNSTKDCSPTRTHTRHAHISCIAWQFTVYKAHVILLW